MLLKPSTAIICCAKAISKMTEDMTKNKPRLIFKTNNLKLPYESIINNCNTIRLRYFEGNYERIKM